MNFELSDEQKMLAEEARRLMSATSPPDRLRALIDAGAEWDEPLWQRLRDAGYLAVALPEEFGGLGLTEVDLGLVSLELGRANACLPFFSSLVLAAGALRLAASTEQQQRWLPPLAAGEAVATFAWPGTAGATIELRGNTLHGFADAVADAGVARHAIVVAASGARTVLAWVDLEQTAVRRTRLDSFDQLRPHYLLEFDATHCEVLGAVDDATAALATLRDRAATQAAFEAVGGAEACLTMSRDYAMQRKIFGRLLAGYQAIKHRLADIFVATELARSSAYFAAWIAGTDPAQFPAAAAAARLMATRAFEQAARENLQIHGGIGYTFEANCHFYYRRERTLAATLGTRSAWADRLLRHLPGGEGAH